MDENNNNGFFDMFNEGLNNNSVQTPVEQPVPQATQPEQSQQEVIQATRIPKNQQQPVNQPVQPQLVQPVQPQQEQPSVPRFNPNPIKTDGSTQQNLAILMNIKDYYTEPEWTQKFTLYMMELKKIEVDPMRLNASDIAVAAGRIDTLLTPARFDFAIMNKAHGHYEMLLKLEQQNQYVGQKQDDEQNKVKHNIDDTKALATMRVSSNRNYEDGLNLFELESRYAGRMIQAKTILDVLSDKKDILITYAAALKIENTANNFTASVPTDRQINQMRS